MQPVKFDEVIERVVEKKGLSKENAEILKSIGLSVFSETKKEMSLFGNLSLHIPGLINIFYGRKRMQDMAGRIDRKLSGEEVRISFLENKSEPEIVEIKNKINNLLSIYETYVKERKETKTAFKEAKKSNYGSSNSSN